MSIPDYFSYHFFPVGQGLFASGAIRCCDQNGPLFLWVYDCGSSSGHDLVDNGVQVLEDFARNRMRIDLLVLSHFDHDHISGICRLLQKFEIGTLLLPYMSLAQRLIVAFEEGSGDPDDSLSEFFLNPVAYLLAQEGPGIDRILFVMPSGDNGPEYPGEPEQRGPEPDGQSQMVFPEGRPDDPTELQSLTAGLNAKGRPTNLVFLRRGSAITLRTARWEFVPYNDDPEEPIPQNFTDEVDIERVKFLSGGSPDARNDALRKLKRIYDKHFGSGSEERNIISLFLYSGPLYPSWRWCLMTEARSRSVGSSGWLARWPFSGGRVWALHELSNGGPSQRASILYTGDGYLDSNERLQNLVQFLGLQRVQRTGVFQVMHHGAKTNWHQGVAAAIGPLFSVFSSDPERKKWRHPHASVLRDFWHHGAVQVDKEKCFTTYGVLHER